MATLGTAVPATVSGHVRLRRVRSGDGFALPRTGPVRDQAPPLHPPARTASSSPPSSKPLWGIRRPSCAFSRRHSSPPCSTTGFPTKCAPCAVSRSSSRARGPSSVPTARSTSSATGTSSRRPQQLERAHYDLGEVIEDSVTAHLVSDVPVSSFLSGGLDSSIVTVLAKRANPEIDAYTITFRAQDHRLEAMPDDAVYARKIAQRHGIDPARDRTAARRGRPPPENGRHPRRAHR